jgi:CRP-like cAMP-binding protein
MTTRPPVGRGPILLAAPFMGGTTELVQLLTPSQQAQLAKIGELITVERGHVFYKSGAPAQWMFLCQEGAVKSYRELPSGTQRIKAFLFAGDIFGLAEAGRYVNTVRALTRVTCYRIPLKDLTALLQRDAALEFHFLAKVTHALRTAERKAIMMGRRDTPGRLAMFLLMLRRRLPGSPVVPLLMSRTDIAGFLGHSLEAVSRAATRLSKQGIIALDRNQVRILDPIQLERLASNV